MIKCLKLTVSFSSYGRTGNLIITVQRYNITAGRRRDKAQKGTMRHDMAQ